MQVACEIIRSRIKDPNKVQPGDLILPFKTSLVSEAKGNDGKRSPSGFTKEQIRDMQLGKWAAACGAPITGLPPELAKKLRPEFVAGTPEASQGGWSHPELLPKGGGRRSTLESRQPVRLGIRPRREGTR